MAYTVIIKPATGTGVSKANFGDPVVDNLDYFNDLKDSPVFVPLNGATPLVNGDKAYFRIPAKLNGGTIVAVAAACKDASTIGNVELTIKNGLTPVLSTNITIDQGETDTLTATTPAVIDTDADDLATGDLIEFSVVSAGTGVTYCGIEITFRPS